MRSGLVWNGMVGIIYPLSFRIFPVWWSDVGYGAVRYGVVMLAPVWYGKIICHYPSFSGVVG